MSHIHHRIIRTLGLNDLVYQGLYTVSNIYFRFYFRKRKKGVPIFVYQMGRVGSRTVVDTLNSQNISRPIFHIHYLRRDGLDFLREKAEFMERAYPGKAFWAGLFLRENLDKYDFNYIDIIVLTRDPVARNLSAFFHSMDFWYPQLRNYSDKNEFSEEIYSQIKTVFLEHYNHERPLQWFDQELKEVFGINVFQEKFPTHHGYQIYQHSQARVLVIKLERLNEVYRQALKAFLDLDFTNISLAKANVSDSKSYNQLYQKFINWLRLPKKYLDRMYSSQYARHFYTREEISIFRKRWTEIKDIS